MISDPTPDAIFGHGFADIIDSYNWENTIKMVENTSPRRWITYCRRQNKTQSL